jgi:ribosomal protein L14E/L6E/L27E
MFSLFSLFLFSYFYFLKGVCVVVNPVEDKFLLSGFLKDDIRENLKICNIPKFEVTSSQLTDILMASIINFTQANLETGKISEMRRNLRRQKIEEIIKNNCN